MKTFHRILVPVDGSPASSQALVAALDMARGADAQLRLVHHLNEFEYMKGYQYAPGLVAEARRYADGVLTQAIEMAAAAGVKGETRLLEEPGMRLGEAIAREAEDWGADLIVVGTHGRRGFERLMVGSGAEQIIRLAPCAVLAYRRATSMSSGSSRPWAAPSCPVRISWASIKLPSSAMRCGKASSVPIPTSSIVSFNWMASLIRSSESCPREALSIERRRRSGGRSRSCPRT